MYYRAIIIALMSFGTVQVTHAEQKLSTNGLYFSEPLQGLSQELGKRFEMGRALFSHLFGPQDGLGPEYNEHSCATCHAVPLAGGAGISRLTFVQNSNSHTDKAGGKSVAKFRILNNGTVITNIDTKFPVRRPPSLFGLGLLEAILSKEIMANADPNDENNDGISGRYGGHSKDSFGRFGWKARFDTIGQFNAAALVNELGLTTTPYPADGRKVKNATPEVSDYDLESLRLFVQLLAAPPNHQGQNPNRTAQMKLFQNSLCDQCHKPSWKIGKFILPEFSGTTISPYTDLLLHDMGDALADGIIEGRANGREFRTPPLWGLKYLGPPYLHDGRAADIHEAIIMHSGEAKSSILLYRKLNSYDKNILLQFLRSL